MQIANTLRLLGTAPGVPKSWEQDRAKHPNNCDDRKELEQSETRASAK
jgi:hypothetical protein